MKRLVLWVDCDRGLLGTRGCAETQNNGATGGEYRANGTGGSGCVIYSTGSAVRGTWWKLFFCCDVADRLIEDA